jgi:murein DD-endopeptidase MepM/ murein hydrolase activator NlpD
VATLEPSPTPPPPSPTPEPTVPPTPTQPPPPLVLLPPQIVQGGTSVIVLNEPATSATLTFLGRQYPMLRHGQSWWAVVGVGALASVGQHAVAVVLIPPGRSQAANVYASLSVLHKAYPLEHIELDSTTASLLAPDIVRAELNQRAEIFAGYTAQRLWSGPFRRPSSGPISSRYGELRSYNRAPATDYHKGTDFVGEVGAPVTSAAAGRVVFTGELRVRGNAVMVDHGAGVFTAYHHLSSIAVQRGDLVEPGQAIGGIGATGLVTGPHLHWEVVIRGVEVDGEIWLENREIGPV